MKIFTLLLSLSVGAEIATARDYTIYLNAGDTRAIRDYNGDTATVVCEDRIFRTSRINSYVDCVPEGSSTRSEVVTLYDDGQIIRNILGRSIFLTNCLNVQRTLSICPRGTSCVACACPGDGGNYKLELVSFPSRGYVTNTTLATFVFESQCMRAMQNNPFCRTRH